MAKKTEAKELRLEDFFTNTINANGSKMTLQMNGIDTEHYFIVSGIDCKSASRERINTRSALSLIDEQLKEMEEGELKSLEVNRLVDDAYKPLALALINGWSFGEFSEELVKKILDENEGLSYCAVAHASDESNLQAKK